MLSENMRRIKRLIAEDNLEGANYVDLEHLINRNPDIFETETGPTGARLIMSLYDKQAILKILKKKERLSI